MHKNSQFKIKHDRRKKKYVSVEKLALQLVLVKKADNLYAGRQNVFKNMKQDRQVELLFTEERCNYFNKSVQHQQSVNSSDTQVKSRLIPRLCALMEN